MANFQHFSVDKGSYILVRPLVFADVVKVLLDLAVASGHRVDAIATDTDEGFAVRVPHNVYLRFLDYIELVDPRFGESELPASLPDAGNGDVIAPPRKRGRPRKNPLPGEEG